MTRVAMVAILGCCVVYATPASAQPKSLKEQLAALSTEEKRALQDALFLGRKLQEQGQHEAALAQFERASKILALPDLDYRKAISLEKLNRHEASIEAYERFLRAKPDTPARAEIDASLRGLRARLEAARRAIVRVESDPTGASVFVAGETSPRGVTPIEMEFAPDASVTLRMSLQGHSDLRREVTPKPGTTVSVSVTLEPKRAEVKPPAPDTGPTPLVWGLGLGSVLCLGTSAGFFVAYGLSESEVQARSDRSEPRSFQYNTLVEEQNSRAFNAWVLLGVGAVLGAGAWVSHTQPAIVAPLFGPRGEIGLRVQGRF